MREVIVRLRRWIARPLLEERDEKYVAEKETIMRTLLMVRRERDNHEVLLSLISREGLIPEGPLQRHVNCSTAIESESDVDRRDAAVAALKAML